MNMVFQREPSDESPDHDDVVARFEHASLLLALCHEAENKLLKALNRRKRAERRAGFASVEFIRADQDVQHGEAEANATRQAYHQACLVFFNNKDERGQ